jgi:TRAP-type C4-dicarboxylate transport system permease small subunit
MSKIDDILFSIEKITILVMCSLMVSIVSLEVFCRYCIGTTLMVGIQEIAKWAFVWLATIACAAVLAREKHIAVEYFVKRFFPTPVQNWIYIITQVFVLFFLISVVVSGFPFAIDQWHMRATSTDIPKTFVYLSIPVSMSFMVFHTLIQLISRIRSMRVCSEHGDKKVW